MATLLPPPRALDCNYDPYVILSRRRHRCLFLLS